LLPLGDEHRLLNSFLELNVQILHSIVVGEILLRSLVDFLIQDPRVVDMVVGEVTSVELLLKLVVEVVLSSGLSECPLGLLAED